MSADPRRRAPLRRDEGGITIVETAVSVVILAIMVGLAFGGTSLIHNRRLAGAARDIVSEVRWVAQRAQTERRCWQIVFDPAGEHYHIQFLVGGSWTAGGGCTGGTWTDYTDPGGRFLARNIDLSGTTFTGNTMTVTPFGGMNAGVVTLLSPYGEQRQVDVNTAGRVVILP